MADLLDSIHSELRARLQELRPLVAEYEQLEAALSALASTNAAGASTRSARSRTRTASRTRARRQPSKSRAPRGRNKAVIFDAIRSTPEATVTDLHEATGIDKPVIYNVTRKAIEDGELERVVLAGGIQGFKVTSAKKASEPRKPARRRSRRKRSTPATGKATEEKATTTPEAGEQPSEPEKPAA